MGRSHDSVCQVHPSGPDGARRKISRCSATLNSLLYRDKFEELIPLHSHSFLIRSATERARRMRGVIWFLLFITLGTVLFVCRRWHDATQRDSHAHERESIKRAPSSMHAYHLLKLKCAAERTGGNELDTRRLDDESSRAFYNIFLVLMKWIFSNAITL